MAFVPLWFILIAVLWTGFFVLEGFDMGVGMLHAVTGKDEPGKEAVLATIGPLWDGNEVWLVVAAAAMFAAFPGWYATMFSGFYLLFVILLAGLIARGVSFEFRGKADNARWRGAWDVSMTVGSLIVAAGLGIALGDLLHGVPIDENQEFTGSVWSLLQPYALFTGLTVLLLCLVHGSTFLALTTQGEIHVRARRSAAWLAPVTGFAVLGFVAWTHASQHKGVLVNPIEACALLAVFAAAWLAAEGRTGWAFGATTIALASTIGSIFVNLYPRVMVSSTNSSYSLTVSSTASGNYALKVITVIALVMLPVVLTYQTWSYHVFHRRLTARSVASPAASDTTTAPRQP
jgi:cytochrome d ubiquinol oxidase subunit II